MSHRRYAFYQGTATNEPGASYYLCDSLSDLPGNGLSGDMAYVVSTNAVYFFIEGSWVASSLGGGGLPPTGHAGGDLSGTYPNPAVAAITETSGPTQLVIGAIANGEFVKRVGATLVSGTGLSASDASWPKQYFSSIGILTGLTQKFEFFADAPSAPTVVSSSWTQIPGRFYSAGEGLCYYDLGAVYTKVFIWTSGVDPTGTGGVIMVSHNAPVTDVPDGYAMWKDSQQRMYAQVGGSFNQLGAAVTTRIGPGVGWGLYFEPNVQKQFVRVGAEQPYIWLSRTDGTYTTGFRYVSFFAYGGSTAFDSTTEIWAG